MEIINVGVIGAGTMGNGIAHVFAKTGYNVTLCDPFRVVDSGGVRIPGSSTPG